VPDEALLAELLHSGGIRGVVTHARRFSSNNVIKLGPDEVLGAGADLVTDAAFRESRLAFSRIALGKSWCGKSNECDRSESIKFKFPHLNPPEPPERRIVAWPQSTTINFDQPSFVPEVSSHGMSHRRPCSSGLKWYVLLQTGK